MSTFLSLSGEEIERRLESQTLSCNSYHVIWCAYCKSKRAIKIINPALAGMFILQWKIFDLLLLSLHFKFKM